MEHLETAAANWRKKRRVDRSLPLPIAIAILFSLSAPAEAVNASLEQAVKASYLFKFAPFVEWPAGTLTGTGGAFQICIAGQDPFGSVMDDVVRGQKIGGRAVAVRRLTGPTPAQCNILFLGKQASGNGPGFDTAGKPILTVSDSESDTNGAMIQFLMRDGRVRFQINERIAKANGLKISSKLLNLAVSVDRN